jgi:molecular chaperone HtpG
MNSIPIFYKEFGRILKEGVHYDFSRKEKIAELLLFQSSLKGADEYTTLQDYVDKMPEDQKDIYYIVSTSREEAAKSPYLEAFKEKGYEVLIMLDEVDDVIMSSLGEFKGKNLKSVIKGDITLDKQEEGEKQEAEKKFKEIIELIKFQLKDEVKDVRMSGRLKDTACCLVAEEGGIDPQMEKLMKAMGQNIPENQRILEINPVHPLFEAMKAIFDKEPKSPVLDEYIRLLYDQALLLEGSKPKDPAAFASAITKLMVKNAEKDIV